MDSGAVDESIHDWRALGRRLSNWGRWGDDDELGTRNLITPERVAASAALVRSGRIFDLAIPLDEHGPQAGSLRSNPRRLMSVIGGVSGPGAQRFNDDWVIMPLQAGTQWDGLSHVYYDDVMYNGVPASEVDAGGAHRLGIETQGKGVVGRGVLLDVAGFLDVDWLPGGHVITPAQLDEVAAHQGVEIQPGDILLVRTGWRRRFLSDHDGAGFLAEEPGIGLACLPWLKENDIAAVASDNWAVEAVPFELAEEVFPVHMVMIRDLGLLVGEMWDLEELAADCAADGVYEFQLCAPVPKFTGAVGAPIAPLAIK